MDLAMSSLVFHLSLLTGKSVDLVEARDGLIPLRNRNCPYLFAWHYFDYRSAF